MCERGFRDWKRRSRRRRRRGRRRRWGEFEEAKETRNASLSLSFSPPLSPPRDTLMIIAPLFSFFKDSALIKCFVEALRGTCRDRTSLSSRRASSESTNLAPRARAEGLGTMS
jgi:hypothetical protein